MRESLLRGVLTVAILANLTAVAHTQEICISSSTALLNAVMNARPGETLVLAPGVYGVPQLALRNLRGTGEQWIVVRSASATQRATILGIGAGAAVCIEDCRFVRLEDLDIAIQGGGMNRHGVCFSTGTTSEHIVLDHCRIQNVTGHGIGSEANSLQHLSVLACEINDCDRRGIDLGTLGSQQATAWATIRDSVIRRTGDGTGAHGIHIKPPSIACTIENNVLVDTGSALGAGITTYHAGPNAQGGRPRSEWHTIRGNVVIDRAGNQWQGIYVANSAIVTDNIVLGADRGIAVYPYRIGDVVDNLLLAHNTIYNARSIGVQFLGGPFPPSVVVVNNASVVDQNAVAYDGGVGLGSAVFASNGAHGRVLSIPMGIIQLGPPSTLFVSPTTAIPGVDLYPLLPNSGLVGSAQVVPPTAFDLNGVRRPTSGADLGAYQAVGPRNPGWAIDSAAKTSVQALRPTWAEIATSGRVDWTLTSHAPAGAYYVLLASATGARDHPIPLVFDALTSLVFDLGLGSVFVQYLGVLPSTGVARPSLVFNSVPYLPCSLTLYHAGVVLGPRLEILEISNLARVVVRR